MNINAAEARQITSDNLRGPAIEGYVKTLDVKIHAAASKGQSVIRPFDLLDSLRGTTPTLAERIAIRKHYEALGFQWKDHADPDPGHPCSRPYSELIW